MIDQVEETYSALTSPAQIKGSLAELNMDCPKYKIILSLPQEDCNDETSTAASSRFCSQTFEMPAEKVPRKRSLSNDFTFNFDKIYTNIESYLDQEGLYITSPSPVVHCKTLKPCMKMSDLSIFTKNLTEKGGISPCLSAGPMSKSALPSFMVKRASSSGNVTKVKCALFTETKRNSAMSAFYSCQNTEPETPTARKSESEEKF